MKHKRYPKEAEIRLGQALRQEHPAFYTPGMKVPRTGEYLGFRRLNRQTVHFLGTGLFPLQKGEVFPDYASGIAIQYVFIQ